MRILTALLLCLLAGAVSAQAQNVRPIFDNSANQAGDFNRPVDVTHGLPVQQTAAGSAGSPIIVYQKNRGTVTYTKTVVALTGSSQTLLAANANRSAFVVFNIDGNNSVWVDISGGTASSSTARTVAAGADYGAGLQLTPTSAITIQGTNGQSVVVWEGQ